MPFFFCIDSKTEADSSYWSMICHLAQLDWTEQKRWAALWHDENKDALRCRTQTCHMISPGRKCGLKVRQSKIKLTTHSYYHSEGKAYKWLNPENRQERRIQKKTESPTKNCSRPPLSQYRRKAPPNCLSLNNSEQVTLLGKNYCGPIPPEISGSRTSPVWARRSHNLSPAAPE